LFTVGTYPFLFAAEMCSCPRRLLKEGTNHLASEMVGVHLSGGLENLALLFLVRSASCHKFRYFVLNEL
jgi:hypothetical protein